MCRAEEQNASIFGHKGKAQAQASPEIADEHPPRYRGMPDTPNERLVTVLQEALDVAGGMDPYLLEVCTPASDACNTLGNATETADWGAMYEAGKTMFRFSNAWTTDLVEAKTLAMFAYMLKARRVMEIGMFTGYGALSIAEVLPAGGKMVTCEIDPFLKEFTRPFFDASPHGSKIEVRIGSAIDTMRSFDINAEEGFDMIFIDADKGGYEAYYEACLSVPGLLAEGGVIVVDNVLFKGQAYRPRQAAAKDYASWNEGGTALADFNAKVAADPRTEQVMLPVRDGITIVRRVIPAAGNAVASRPSPVAAIASAVANGAAAIASAVAASPPASAAVASPSAPVTPHPSAGHSKVLASLVMPTEGDLVCRGVGGRSVLDRMRLDGKVALVTGAGQGIGRAFAHALGEAGASVVVADMDATRAQAVATELTAKGIAAVAHVANVTKEAEVKAMVACAVSTYGGLHIAVNNAGVNANSAAEDTAMSEWDRTFDVNTRATFMCCQLEGRHMLAHGGGAIINTASMASLIVPHPQKQAAYNCSKAAVVKMTQSLACEWASRGVKVNCISPGIVDTPLIWDNPALKPLADKWIEDMPIGKLCQVTDLQAAIVYLASEASDYMVGHNLVIEGGQSLW